MRAFFTLKCSGILFGSQCEGLAGFLNHFTHFADAFRALGLTTLGSENVFRARRTGVDSRLNVASADAVTVTDVQGHAPKLENGSSYHRFQSVQLIRKSGKLHRYIGKLLLTFRAWTGRAGVWLVNRKSRPALSVSFI